MAARRRTLTWWVCWCIDAHKWSSVLYEICLNLWCIDYVIITSVQNWYKTNGWDVHANPQVQKSKVASYTKLYRILYFLLFVNHFVQFRITFVKSFWVHFNVCHLIIVYIRTMVKIKLPLGKFLFSWPMHWWNCYKVVRFLFVAKCKLWYIVRSP